MYIRATSREEEKGRRRRRGEADRGGGGGGGEDARGGGRGPLRAAGRARDDVGHGDPPAARRAAGRESARGTRGPAGRRLDEDARARAGATWCLSFVRCFDSASLFCFKKCARGPTDLSCLTFQPSKWMKSSVGCDCSPPGQCWLSLASAAGAGGAVGDARFGVRSDFADCGLRRFLLEEGVSAGSLSA